MVHIKAAEKQALLVFCNRERESALKPEDLTVYSDSPTYRVCSSKQVKFLFTYQVGQLYGRLNEIIYVILLTAKHFESVRCRRSNHSA